MESVLILLSTSYLPFSILVLIVIVFWTPHRFKKHVVLFAVAFGLIGYCYNPTYEIDLSRYFYSLDTYRNLSLQEALAATDDGLVVRTIVFWIVSKTGDNHILPLLSMSTVFGISAYITADSVGTHNKLLWKVLLFQLLFIPFYSTLSNVRNVSAFALILLAVYRDQVKHKRNICTILLYILPCFIHMSGLILLLFRIGLIFIKRHPYIGLTIALGIPSASIALYERVGGRINLPGHIGAIISRAIWKAYASTVNSSDYAVTTRQHGYFNACRVVTFIMLLLMLILLLHQLKNDESRWRDYKVYCGMLIAITLIWIALGTVKYWVFDFIVVIGCGPILVAQAYENMEGRFMRIIWRPIMATCLLARFALEIYYIGQRINISDYLSNFFTCSLWVVLGEGIKTLFLTI